MEPTAESFECPRCKERGQTWDGSPPICGFDRSGEFKRENWNCATLNALREVANKTRCDDHNVGILGRGDVGFGILTWYKSRGKTDSFMNGFFKEGSLEYAQQLLGDVDPDDPWIEPEFDDPWVLY